MWDLSLEQLINYYEYGIRFDMERRGFTSKDDIDKKSMSEVRREVYNKEELQAQEDALKKQFGNNTEGL